MKKILFIYRLFLLGAAAPLLAWPGSVLASGTGLMERINHADEPLPLLPVQELPLKTVLAKDSYQGGDFRVLARKGAISRYRCSVCHTDKAAPQVKDGVLFSHADIELNHGRGVEKLACIECHDEKNRDLLSDAQGQKIDFDHSYQLCGQCHFRQKRDWLGGAHGKREGFWAGERLIHNCTSCHNPHSPAFKSKLPETYSLPLDD
ncbi:MAG: hypothetical protein ABFR97_02730 [Thermodesulfobacteriota bacterium]